MAYRIPSLCQMGVGKSVKLALLLALILAGCSAHRPIQRTSEVMDKLTASWFAIESTAVSLHDAGILKGEKWDQVVAIRNQISPLMRQLWTQWALLPDTETAVEEFLRSPNYENVIRMIAQMTAIIGGIN